ncbi:MAG: Ig-like domain-containing protein [Caldilinea sp.]|nr:Ig-like domain-containing protein [Caldilinea sp.]
MTPVNDAPVAAPDVYATDEDTPLTVAAPGVLGNDGDVDGDALSATQLTDPAHGTLSFNSDGSFTYAPEALFNGTDTFTYQAGDGSTTSAETTVSINVASINNAPACTDSTVSTAEDTAMSITLTCTDVDSNALGYVVVTPPQHGTLSGTAPNLTYTPAANYHDGDSFTFAASDGAATSNIATVTIGVTPVNDAPVATAQAVVTAEDTPLAITLAGSDIDGDSLTFAVAIPPQHGTLSGTAPNLTYTPAANYNGSDSFTFAASDGAAISNIATVAINVTPVNDAPVATAQVVATAEDTPLAITLAGSDIDGDALTFAVVTPPQNGMLSGTAPNLTYTPAANFNGSDSFTFAANDGTATSAPATVTIDVTPANDVPTATPQSVTTAEDTPLAITLAGSDIDGDPLTFAVVTPPQNGTLSGSAPNLTYTPAANFNGSDSFTFAASDGSAVSNIATVAIGVTPLNDAPVATVQSVTTAEDTPTAITLAGSDVDGDDLTFAVATPPQHGTLSGSAPDLTYTPAADFNGSDSFTFTVDDGTATSTPVIVAISVTPVNDAPVATADVYATSEETLLTVAAPGVLANDSDLDGDALTVVGVSSTAHGTLTLATDGSFTYLPDAFFAGSDTFVYKAGDGLATSNPVTVTVNVHAVNHAPICTAVSATSAEDTATGLSLACTDRDGDALEITIVATPGHGTLSGTSPEMTYAPAPDYHGTDQFTFHATDGAAESNIATATITITPVNDAPRIEPIADQSDVEGDAVELAIAASDIDGDSLRFAATGLPAGLTIDPATGVIAGQLGAAAVDATYPVTVTVDDGHGGQTTLSFQWTVKHDENPGGQSSYPLFLPAIAR